MDESRNSFSLATSVLARAQSVAGVLHERKNKGNALRLIKASATLKTEVDRLLAASVEEARRGGVTWQEVGDTLNISRQAAYQRFGQATDPRTGKTVPKDISATAVKRAETVFMQLSAGSPELVYADFDEQMSSAMTVKALGDMWASLLATLGTLESIGEPAAHRVGELSVIDIPLSFEVGHMIGKVSLHQDGRIAGLFILNAPDGQSTNS